VDELRTYGSSWKLVASGFILNKRIVGLEYILLNSICVQYTLKWHNLPEKENITPVASEVFIIVYHTFCNSVLSTRSVANTHLNF